MFFCTEEIENRQLTRKRCPIGTPGTGLNIPDSKVQKHIMASLWVGPKTQKDEEVKHQCHT